MDHSLLLSKNIQVKYNSKVVKIRSNFGTEFENLKMHQFGGEHRSIHSFLAPRTCQQNGVVEGKNKTLVDILRTMLIDSNLPKNFWLNVSFYVTNICLTRLTLNKTPYELMNNIKPKLGYLSTFGCLCLVLNNSKDDLGKFDP